MQGQMGAAVEANEQVPWGEAQILQMALQVESAEGRSLLAGKLTVLAEQPILRAKGQTEIGVQLVL